MFRPECMYIKHSVTMVTPENFLLLSIVHRVNDIVRLV